MGFLLVQKALQLSIDFVLMFEFLILICLSLFQVHPNQPFYPLPANPSPIPPVPPPSMFGSPTVTPLPPAPPLPPPPGLPHAVLGSGHSHKAAELAANDNHKRSRLSPSHHVNSKQVDDNTLLKQQQRKPSPLAATPLSDGCQMQRSVAGHTGKETGSVGLEASRTSPPVQRHHHLHHHTHSYPLITPDPYANGKFILCVPFVFIRSESGSNVDLIIFRI